MTVQRTKHTTIKALLAVATAAGLALFAAGCGSDADGGAGSSGSKPTVVTSTSMWGAVAKAVAGDHADVRSIIANPNQDPHGYESTAQDKLAVQKASVVVVNGGGYDDWATSLATSTDKGKDLIDAVKTANLPGTGGKEFNEHVWYSLDAVKATAKAVSDKLSAQDKAHAADYASNLSSFSSQVDELKTQASGIGAKHKGATYVSTEPVAVHLFDTIGLTDATPEAFTEQSETDAGPSVAVLNQMVTLVKSGTVKLLAINPQTEDAASKQVISAAKGAKVPSVNVYETLPKPDQSYVDFIKANLVEVSTALG